MARIRTIKPEFWADEKLGPLDPLTRLVFLGLISQADDAGRVLDSVKLLDGLLFPYTSDTCRRSLDDLSRQGVIRRGTTRAGQAVIQIVNWHHQKIDKPNLSAALDSISTDSPIDRRQIADASAPHSSISTGIYDHVSASVVPARTLNVDDPWEGLDAIVIASLRGLYGGPGREGTDEAVWKAGNGIDRERALAGAILRWRGEVHEKFNQRLFRKILEAVIAEQSHQPTGEKLWA